MSWSLVENSYGKSRVRVTKVTRLADRHDYKELSVDIQLYGDFAKSYTDGDNSSVVPTDTMKNTVYAIASSHPLDSIESFGKALVEYFLGEYSHIDAVSVSIAEDLWVRIPYNGGQHPYAFTGGSKEKRITHVDAARDGNIETESGIEDLVVVKTTASEFHGYIKDKWTTLPETNDRIFGTAVRAVWSYKNGAPVDYNAVHEKVRATALRVFCEHHSLAVQQTLYEMAKQALDACDVIDEIRIEMPNQHRIPFDLTRLGLENKNEIFVTTDEPFGLISATVTRAPVAALPL